MPSTNRLATATSPYLLQHAHNPVDWYPWGEEALARARSEDRLILLSIGYAACHWCHVMAHESFENETIAALMNEHFVNVKVDREERPDLDDLYMAATQAMNDGQGGWPMTLFLTPTLEPIFAGTYFPPEDRWGRPGFPTLLHGISSAWQERREELRAHGRQVMGQLARAWEVGVPRSGIEQLLPRAVASLARALDRRAGGFGGAPKFPPHSALSLLHRAAAQGVEEAAETARITLDGILRGGIHDHLGGGFARYAVDALWLVPHFEKMLTDNALLVTALVRSFQLAPTARDRSAIVAAIGFLTREMLLPEGAFASSLDADSEGEEGRFYLWTPAQVHEALGDAKDTELACAFWDIDEHGHLEGKAVPNLLRADLATFAQHREEDEAELEVRIGGLRTRLLAARALRERPGRDDKVICGWNGLVIGALAEAGRVLDQPQWVELARAAADFVLAEQSDDRGGLRRSWRRGVVAPIPGFLDDYAFLIDGLITLAEAGGGARFLDRAAVLAQVMLERFAEPGSGALNTTPHDAEPLPARTRESHDGATPAAPAVAARALLRLADHFDRPDWRVAAQRAIEVDGAAAFAFPRGFCSAIEAADHLARGAVEVAIVGDPQLEATRQLHRVVAAVYVPNLALASWHPDDRPSDRDRPLLLGRSPAQADRAVAFVCRRGVCSLPIEDPRALLRELGGDSSRS